MQIKLRKAAIKWFTNVFNERKACNLFMSVRCWWMVLGWQTKSYSSKGSKLVYKRVTCHYWSHDWIISDALLCKQHLKLIKLILPLLPIQLYGFIYLYNLKLKFYNHYKHKIEIKYNCLSFLLDLKEFVSFHHWFHDINEQDVDKICNETFFFPLVTTPASGWSCSSSPWTHRTQYTQF